MLIIRYLKLSQFTFKDIQKLFYRSKCKLVLCNIYHKSLHTTNVLTKVKEPRNEENQNINMITDEDKPIYLIDENNKLMPNTLLKATKLAYNKGFKIVEIQDPTKHYQLSVRIYKLMPPEDYLAESIKIRKQNSTYKLKGEKQVVIYGLLNQTQLYKHIEQIQVWIADDFRIRVLIVPLVSDDDELATFEDMEKLFFQIKLMMEETGNTIRQLTSPINSIRFFIAPRQFQY